MNTSTAFKAVMGLKLHFSRIDYSILKYGINTKRANDAWTKISDSQKFRYEWLAERFPKMEDLVYANIGCAFDGVDIRYATKETVLESYFKIKRRRDGLEYTLKSDHSRCDFLDIQGNFGSIFKEYIGGKVSPEYVVIADPDQEKLKAMYGDNNYAWCSTKTLHLLKYKGFIPSHYFQLLKENETAT